MTPKFRTEKEAEEALKPRLTDEFLDTLRECLLIAGWTYDFVETAAFVGGVFSLAGRDPGRFFIEGPYEFDE